MFMYYTLKPDCFGLDGMGLRFGQADPLFEPDQGKFFKEM